MLTLSLKYRESKERLIRLMFVFIGLRSQLMSLAIQVSFSTEALPTSVAVSVTPKLPGSLSLLSSGYILQASMICFSLLRHMIPSALVLALASAGSRRAARIAMMAMTTSSSISVNARDPLPEPFRFRSRRVVIRLTGVWQRGFIKFNPAMILPPPFLLATVRLNAQSALFSGPRFPDSGCEAGSFGRRAFFGCALGPRAAVQLFRPAQVRVAGHGLRPGTHLEFLIHAPDVGVDGGHADVEPLGNFLIEIAAR